MDHPEPSIDPALRTAGRGARSNEAGRHEAYHRTFDPDGWGLPAEEMVARTHVQTERPRQVITRNRSPDLPFNRSINPYRGCEHGCIYCFARPSHAWLGMSPGLDFETRLIARPGAAEQLETELARSRYQPATIAIGTNTDPYQPIERDHGITRACLEVLARFDHPVAVVTKGALIERDIDILAPMAAKGLARVGISVTTLDAGLGRRMEPRAPGPARRFKAIRRLAEAGIPVRIMTSPLIPGLTDHEMEAMLAAGKEAGARAASWVMLRLPREVAPLFRDWLAQHYPARARRVMGHLRDMHGGKAYEAAWHRRMRGEGPFAELMAQRFQRATRRLGLDAHLPPLRTDLFAVPPRSGDQLSLF